MELRALVIDDSPVMRQVICRSLRLSGLAFSECVEASNGEQALELLHQQPVDVILCDINMPQMDGEQLLEKIEKDPKLSSIPVLIVTADATAPRVQRMLGLGAQGYLLKPFSPERLRSEIRRILPQH